MTARSSSLDPVYLGIAAILCLLPHSHGQEIEILASSEPNTFAISWPSEAGQIYQVEKSFDLVSWEPVPYGRRSGSTEESTIVFLHRTTLDPPEINEIESVLIGPETTASFLVPQNGDLGTTWTGAEFDASSWSTSLLGIGYDTAGANGYHDLFGHEGSTESSIQSAMRGPTAVSSMFVRIPFLADSSAETLHLNMRMDDGFVAYLNGSPVASEGSPNPTAPEWNAAAIASSDEEITLGAGLTFDLTDKISTLLPGENLLAIHGLNKSIGDSDFLILPTLVASRFEETVEKTAYLRVTTRTAATEPRFSISEFMAVNDDLIFDEDGDSPDWIEIVNTGAAIASLRDWSLTDNRNNLTKWKVPDIVLDAGERVLIFASTKNRRAIGKPLHTDFSLSRRGEFLALVMPDGTTTATRFDPDTGEVGQQFANISYGPTPSDEVAGYMVEPTPGSTNSTSSLYTGPAIRDVVHTPNHGPADQPITVEAVVLPRDGDIATVELGYRVMYQPERRVSMAPTGNNKFTAEIPADAFEPGEMVRYYVIASDTGNRTARKPEHLNAEESAEYLGTVLQATDVPDTKLPILEWFVEDPRWHREAGGNNRDEAPVAVFYDGRFYDNIKVRTRGGTSQRLAKPNFKFDFYNGGHFTYDSDKTDVEEFNLQSFAGEIWTPSYMRNALGYKTFRAAGVAAPFTFYVHVRQNGEFYSLAAIEEQIDERFLARHGMNEKGALYKAHLDAWLDTERTQNKWETDWNKRIPEDLDFTDLASFTDGLSLEDPWEREAFIFDNVNLPQVIHYLAVTILGPNHDRLQHNFYVHRDSGNTDEWSFLPWDLDRWFPQGVQLSNATMRSIFYGDSDHERADSGIRNQYNRLNDAIFDNPRTREMYVQHVRKVVDEWMLESTFLEDSIDEFVASIEADAVLDNRKWRLGPLSSGASALKSSIRIRRRQLELDRNIPEADTSSPMIAFGAIEPGEYIEIINQRAAAQNISGWKLVGPNPTEFEFQPGTVILGTDFAPNNTLYLTSDVRAFRLREQSPKGGEGHLVQGNFPVPSASGTSFRLVDEKGTTVLEGITP